MIFYTIGWRSNNEQKQEAKTSKIINITNEGLEEVAIKLSSEIFVEAINFQGEIEKLLSDVKDKTVSNKICMYITTESIFFSIYRLNIFSHKFLSVEQEEIFNNQLIESFIFAVGKIYFTSADKNKSVPDGIGKEFFDTFLPSRLKEYGSCKLEAKNTGIRFYGKLMKSFEDENIFIKEKIIDRYVRLLLNKCGEKNLLKKFESL